MDVTAPGFRYASLWGVVLGAIAALVAIVVSILWDRRSRELKVLRARVEQLEKEVPPALPVQAESAGSPVSSESTAETPTPES
jgi:hypothetical protein